MKSKTLTALVLAGALAVGGTKAFAQQVITEPDPTGTVLEYYYTDGRLSGYKDADGSVFELGGRTPTDSGSYTLSDWMTVETGLSGIGTSFSSFEGKSMPTSVEKSIFDSLEDIVKRTLTLPEMQRSYVKTSASDDRYYTARSFLLTAVSYYCNLQSFGRIEGKILNDESIVGYLNNPTVITKDYFDTKTSTVFSAYEAVARMYYNLGRNETDPAKKKEFFEEGARHGYLDLTRKFGEDYVLGKMNKDQNEYLGYVRSCFRYSGQAISANIIETARRITL